MRRHEPGSFRHGLRFVRGTVRSERMPASMAISRISPLESRLSNLASRIRPHITSRTHNRCPHRLPLGSFRHGPRFVRGTVPCLGMRDFLACRANLRRFVMLTLARAFRPVTISRRLGLPRNIKARRPTIIIENRRVNGPRIANRESVSVRFPLFKQSGLQMTFASANALKSALKKSIGPRPTATDFASPYFPPWLS